MKRAFSLVLCIIVLFGVFSIVPVSVEGSVTTADIQKALDNKLSTYKAGGAPPTSLYRNGTSGCFGFADLIYRQIFGHNLPKQISAMELAASTNLTKVGSTLSKASGNLTESNLASLFAKAQIGDVVQMDYTMYEPDKDGSYDSRHTMIVYSVSSTGVVLYHAGKKKIYFGASFGTQPLWGTSGSVLTWSDLMYCLRSNDDGLSVYRSNSSFVNSGNSGGSDDSIVSTNPDDYTYPDPDTTDTIYRTSPTMKDSTVAWVQAVLYQLGYSIEVDGSYGQNSEAVIKQFQSDNGLEVDGRVGPATKRKLLECWNAKKTADSHTCDKNSFFYQSSHPHYLVYKCSVCGKEQLDTSKTQRLDSCNSCLPEKSVLTVVPGTSTEQTTFTWKVAGGADCYELIVYKNGEDKPVQWLYNLTTNQYELQLDAGNYSTYVASINNDLIDSSCWWVYSDKVEFSVPEGEVVDDHTHSYHSTNYAPSSCTEYGYTEYLCDCGDSYIEYDTKLGEHSNLHRVLGEQSESGVNFEYELCRECNHVVDFGVVYPDGLVIDLPLPENTELSDCITALRKMRNDILVDYGLKAGLSTDDEKTIEFSWIAIDEMKATEDEVGSIFDEITVTSDKVSSTEDEEAATEDEVGYYELLIYNSDGFTERFQTTTTACLWGFEPDWQYYTVIITKFNDVGDVIAISSAYSVEIFAIHADWWGYYGDVDLKGGINVKDATLIQKYLANIVDLDKYPLKQADVNSDGKVNIKDATTIQKHCAGFDVDSRIGNEFWDGYTEYSGVRVESAL